MASVRLPNQLWSVITEPTKVRLEEMVTETEPIMVGKPTIRLTENSVRFGFTDQITDQKKMGIAYGIMQSIRLVGWSVTPVGRLRRPKKWA